MSSKDCIKSLNDGFLPICLNYSNGMNEPIDWQKVAYNTFYKTPDFFESKFPPGFSRLPGGDKILDLMAKKAKSPLDEIKLRHIDDYFEEKKKNEKEGNYDEYKIEDDDDHDDNVNEESIKLPISER